MNAGIVIGILTLLVFIVVIINLIIYGDDWTISGIALCVWGVGIILLAPLSNVIEYDKIYKTEIVNYKSIKQDNNGKYFILDDDFNKKYPTIKIVDTESKCVINYYNQSKLDGFIMNYKKIILYLNLSDVEK